MNIENFNILFSEYYLRFIRFALGYVKDSAIAEDFVVESFTAYWQNRASLASDTKPQAYILTSVKNKCLNHLEHLQVRQRAENHINNHSEWNLKTSISTLKACDPTLLFSREIQEIVDQTLKNLPEKTREIFILSRNKGYTYKDIAEEMGISTKTVEFHISKALEQLRIELKDFIYLMPFLILLLN